MKNNFFLVGTIALFTACGGENKPQQTEPVVEEKPTVESCLYSLNIDSTTVSWTAFKTTEKIGVGGKFDTIHISGTNPAENQLAVFNGASFEIPVSSINTANPDRDKKIIDFFFGELDNAGTLSGKLISLTDGKGIVAIQMNGATNEVEMDYTLDGDVINMETTIDVGEWNAQAGVEALNKECYELHMAGDGVSKLWPEVKIGIRSVLNKSCE